MSASAIHIARSLFLQTVSESVNAVILNISEHPDDLTLNAADLIGSNEMLPRLNHWGQIHMI
jgi:hypothetical protein